MSTSVAAASRVALSARGAAWVGIGLGALAWYLTLPPLLVRSAIPSLLIAAAGVAAGVYAIREEERRLGWIAVVVAILGAIGAVVATKSGEGNLERVFVWSALF